MPANPGPTLAIALVVLLALALAGAYLGRLPLRRQLVTASLRAVVQLALVSVVITFVLSALGWAAAFALVMVAVASVTSAQRIGATRSWPWAGLAIIGGVAPTLAVIFASGAVPLTPIAVVPMAGIIIGGAMTATSLTGRRCSAALRDERGSFEAGLSIGLSRADAIHEVIHRHLPEALVPGLDQTRTVGLVTLPGAFVGVLLGGGSPLQAGTAQILVLVGLLATQVITVVIVSGLIGAGRLLPDDLATTLPG